MEIYIITRTMVIELILVCQQFNVEIYLPVLCHKFPMSSMILALHLCDIFASAAANIFNGVTIFS